MSKEIKRRIVTKDYSELKKHILAQITEGTPSFKVIESLVEDGWCRTNRNAADHYYKVLTSFKIADNAELDMARGKYLLMYENLFKKAYDSGDYKTANTILDSIVKLLGIVNTKIENKFDGPVQIIFE